MATGGPAAFVRLKLAGEEAPPTAAVTVSAPAIEFEVNIAEVAMPLAPVVAVVEFVPVSANIPLAPEDGAVNVTIALPTGFCPTSTTVTTKGWVNALVTVVFCAFPPLARIDAGAPVVFVRLKVAGVSTPETDAVTV
jgi:hypothetical protein